MAAQQASAQSCNALSSSIKKVWSDIETQFIKPCAKNLEECGIEGKYKKDIDNLSQALQAKLKSICSNYDNVSASLDNFARDIEGFTSAGKFNSAQSSVDSLKPPKTKKRAKKF